MLRKDYDCIGSVAKTKTCGREPQGARRQDELTDSKPPVLKTLTRRINVQSLTLYASNSAKSN
jgi:hypothetical protein